MDKYKKCRADAVETLSMDKYKKCRADAVANVYLQSIFWNQNNKKQSNYLTL